MTRSTLVKNLVCCGLVAVSFLSPYSTLRLLIVEILGGPLRTVLGNFPALFFRDKPYYNLYGSLAVTAIYAILTYSIWSVVQYFARRRKDVAS
jgi:hypothetical protein